MYIIIAIVAFGILIIIHELGHFAAAKAFGVKVLEFSIGMGPRLFKRQGKETVFSLRALPFGGSCLMEGEDEEVPDPRSFTAQTRWKRIVIHIAGSFMNFLFGVIVVLLLVTQITGVVGTKVTALADGFPSFGENSLLVGDRIVSVNGERLYYSDDFITFMGLAQGKPVDLVIEREGRQLTFRNVPLQRREYIIDGETQLKYGITFNLVEATAGEKLKDAGYTTMNFVRLIKVSVMRESHSPEA
jgi:regulator of sigma E protease